MHLFKAKAEAEAKEKIESYITLVEAEISSQGRDEKLLEYKAIFAKSFFNVAEKPITPENNEIYEQLNKLGGDKITPVGELDYSQAKIPSTQDEYNEAYQRARKAVLMEVNKNYREIGGDSMLKEAKLKEAKLALSSENIVINDIKLFDQELGNRLKSFNNVDTAQRRVESVQSQIEESQNHATRHAEILSKKISSLQSPENARKIQNLGLKEVVQDLLNRSNSINERLATQGMAPDDRSNSINQRLATQGRAADVGNKTQSERETPSSSPKEPKASCLSGMFKAMTNFSSIFHKLRSGSGGSRGGQGR